MVDVSSQNNSVSINVSSGGNSASIKATPDMAQYYSEKSREWAVSNRIVDNTDYSSKHYAEKSKESEAKAENYERSVIEKYNSFIDISNQATSEIIEEKTNAIEQIDTKKSESIAEINNETNSSISAINLSKENAKTEISNSKDSAINQINNTGINTRANLNLSNLSAVGEKHFLNKTQITNCLLEVPQNIKLELTNNGLTLKKGSIVTIPNGTKGYKELTIVSNMTMALTNFTGTEQFVLFYNDNETGSFAGRRLTSQVGSGTTTPTSNHWHYYNTDDNFVYVLTSRGLQDYRASLPLGLITVTDGIITSIDQVFNGGGYLGNTIWADKGIKGLRPNGFNDDGTLNNIEFETTEVMVRTRNMSGSGYLMLSGTNYHNSASAYYEENENKNLTSAGEVLANAIVGTWSADSTGRITEFKFNKPFHAVDYNDALLKSDKAEISGWGMPSSKIVALELGVSGTEYTAPAHGWVYVNKVCGGNGQYINIVNKGNGLSTASVGISSNNVLGVYLPISAGTKFAVNYTASGATNAFRFIYAIGVK